MAQTKTKTRTKAPLLEELTPAPLAAPQTFEEWSSATLDAIYKKDAGPDARKEYRKLMELKPQTASKYGDLPTMYRRLTGDRWKARSTVIEESTKFRMTELRAQLAGADSSPTELLLIDAVLACYHDYWLFLMLYEQETAPSFVLGKMAQWERVLASKETRYLRALETLARVRRLLKLPTMQVNIATAGGQQVNVSGDLKH